MIDALARAVKAAVAMVMRLVVDMPVMDTVATIVAWAVVAVLVGVQLVYLALCHCL